MIWRTGTVAVAAMGLMAAAWLAAADAGSDPPASQEVSIEAIRGIEGIDTVPLQNLEAVLRMQTRPQEQQSQGGGGTAASLRIMETTEDDPQPDTRQDLLTELEGS